MSTPSICDHCKHPVKVNTSPGNAVGDWIHTTNWFGCYCGQGSTRATVNGKTNPDSLERRVK